MHHVRRSRVLAVALAAVVATGGAAAADAASRPPAPTGPDASTSVPTPRPIERPIPASVLADVAIGEAVAVEREAVGAPSSTVVPGA